MLAKVYGCGISGLDAFPVTIEIDVNRGLPGTIIVGLPDNAVRESKERVRAAIRNCGYKYPSKRVTINLSPADTKKEGPAFDLSIALGFLAATEQISSDNLTDYVFLGELSLDGKIRRVPGSLAMALSLDPRNTKGLILPADNAAEAAVQTNVPVYPFNNLPQVVDFLSDPGSTRAQEMDLEELFKKENYYSVDFSDVKGQSFVKRGLEIACAGGHNCLMIGPPGCGKTMLAKRIPTILPDMTLPEAFETTKIHSVMGLLPPNKGLLATRPFRSPHHTASDVALVGGGSVPKPGEVTLSHNGVLFLDELPEFNRNVLEALRQPLEDHQVTVSRASKTVRFPAKFMLVASMNPCPCGFLTDPKKACHCSGAQIQRYVNKISGPLLDRMDIHLEVPALKSYELLASPLAEPSAAIKERTLSAREVQKERFSGTRIYANAQMTSRQLKTFCALPRQSHDLLSQAIDELGLSARAHDKVLKVARTVSDLGCSENILPEHIAEAIQYRSLDRNWWG